MAHTAMSAEVTERAINDALECSRVCEETLSYCLQQGGPHVESEHMKMLMDCAEICHTAAAFMERGSNHHVAVSHVCARICDDCADSCDKFTDDEQMTRCAQACRRCAASCREMASAVVA